MIFFFLLRTNFEDMLVLFLITIFTKSFRLPNFFSNPFADFAGITEKKKIFTFPMIYLCNIYVIMKTMCPPGYHHNGFVATHALGHMMYSYTLIHIVHMITYIMLILLLRDLSILCFVDHL